MVIDRRKRYRMITTLGSSGVPLVQCQQSVNLRAEKRKKNRRASSRHTSYTPVHPPTLPDGEKEPHGL